MISALPYLILCLGIVAAVRLVQVRRLTVRLQEVHKDRDTNQQQPLRKG